MSRHGRGYAGLCVLPLLLGTAGCNGGPPAPADQFKTIAAGKEAQLTRFLDGKQSRLGQYQATVTAERDVRERGDHTHVGLIEFQYAVTRSQGEGGWQYFETAEAVYHFSTKGKKWVFKECFPRHGGRPLELKDEPLVTFAEVQAAFEQEPGERLAAEPGVAPDRRPLR